MKFYSIGRWFIFVDQEESAQGVTEIVQVSTVGRLLDFKRSLISRFTAINICNISMGLKINFKSSKMWKV